MQSKADKVDGARVQGKSAFLPGETCCQAVLGRQPRLRGRTEATGVSRGHSIGTQVPRRAERRGGQELERLVGQAMKAEYSEWRYYWLGEGGEAVGIRPEGRAFPGAGEEMSEAGSRDPAFLSILWRTAGCNKARPVV